MDGSGLGKGLLSLQQVGKGGHLLYFFPTLIRLSLILLFYLHPILSSAYV